jgi:hypothetical protein
MANPTGGAYQPARTGRSDPPRGGSGLSDPGATGQGYANAVLDAILEELRAIRNALENPKDTAVKEIRDAEYPEDAVEGRGHNI